MFFRTKDFWLLVSVFITGFAVLVIEIVALRILSPYFGNTIYTASSVITAVLASLAIGYWIGGRLADRRPSCHVFYFIIFASGLLVLLMRLFSLLVLPFLGAMFSMAFGPLASSLLLFFIPSFSLGMLSPFALRLYHQDSLEVGKRSGEVFFWGTAGSIAGSLATGFFLIPYFGIGAIVVATGILLMLWGCGGYIACKGFSKKMALVMLLPAVDIFLLLWFLSPKVPENIVYQRDGVYEKITIEDGLWNGRQTRFLFQDKSYSAAMYIDSPELVYHYTKYYKLYRLYNPQASRALVIGGGAYSIPKALLADSPLMQVDVAEIEHQLFGLAHQYFNLAQDPRLHVYTQDGRRLLSNNQQPYDVIISDVYYSWFSIPAHLTTKEFFALAKSRLAKNGVFIGNFAGDLSAQKPSFIFSEMRTFREVFPNSYFFAVQSTDYQGGQNIIFMGLNGSDGINLQDAAILSDKDPIISGLWKKYLNPDSFYLNQYQVLTDDYSPVEYLVSRVIKRWY